MPVMLLFNIIVYGTLVQHPLNKYSDLTQSKVYVATAVFGSIMCASGAVSFFLYVVCASNDPEDHIVTHQLKLKEND